MNLIVIEGSIHNGTIWLENHSLSMSVIFQYVTNV